MSFSVAVLVDGGWGPEMLLYPVPQSSARFSSIFLRTIYMWAFEFVDYPTFCGLWSLSLGAMRSVFTHF